MPVWISLLRGVNVAGRSLRMADVAELYDSLGFQNVQTYLQSGNVLFSYQGKDENGISIRIEKELKARKGLDIKVLLRTPSELARIVENHPFKNRNRSWVHVTFLQSKPVKVPTEAISALAAKGEEFAVSNREVFLFLPNGMGRTKLSNNYFEKVLGVPATTRNWNTVTGLLEIARSGKRIS